MSNPYPEYKFVIKVKTTDWCGYYNSGNFLLYKSPYEASRYLNEESAIKSLEYVKYHFDEDDFEITLADFETEYQQYLKLNNND